MQNLKNNELNKNVTLLSSNKRQVNNKCNNMEREETMAKNIDELQNKRLYWFYGLLTK